MKKQILILAALALAVGGCKEKPATKQQTETITETCLIEAGGCEGDCYCSEDTGWYAMIAAEKIEKLGVKRISKPDEKRYLSFALDNGENHIVDTKGYCFGSDALLYEKGKKPIPVNTFCLGFGFDGDEKEWKKIAEYLGMKESEVMKMIAEKDAAAVEAQNEEAGVVDFEKLTLKGDVYYLNNVPFTGKARQEEDCCTEEWEMKDGRFHGKYSGDFPNSGATGTYKDGKKHGEWKELSDGADSYGGYKVGTYKDDKKHGEWKYFNFEDEFKGTETWENGELVSETSGGQAKNEQALPTLTPKTVEFASEAPSAEDAYGFKDNPNGEYYHFGSFVSSGDTQWDGFSYSEKFTATSTLAPQGKVSYNAKNLENNTKVGGIRGTTWCEGVKGHGTGERITMSISTRGLYQDEVSFGGLLIVNGYARNAATWKNNSRAKTLRLYLGGKAWCDLKLSDAMKPQIFTLPENLHIVPAKSGKVVDKGNLPTYQTDLAFEIIEVYPGDKYDDTCITGIALDVATGGVY